MADVERLRVLLGGPDMGWLVQRLRRRLESGQSVDKGTLTLRSPSDAQRDAIGRLFGRRLTSGAAVTVRLSELDAMVRRAELGAGIADAVLQLFGPVADVRGRRIEVERQWGQVFHGATRADVRPSVARWVDDIRMTGLLRRLAGGEPQVGRSLLQQSLAVARQLPAHGVPLAELAATATGDSHALDLGQPVGTLVMRLAVVLSDGATIQTALNRRDVWANVGVLCDELSAPVLVLNLRAGESTPIGRALAEHADVGEPYRLSTRQLLRHPPDFSASASGRTIYVCENPSVVAAAANQLGARSAPLVCVEGHIKTAARLLLDRLSRAGAELAYHGDFDWGGIRIANVIISQCGARPWRYSSADYRAASAGASLRGTGTTACWDPELDVAMRSFGHAVYEEQVLADLLVDLAPRTETR